MGVSKDRHLPDVASIGLGAGEVTPLDMATAYAPLSNGGYRVTPQAISKIVTPGGKEEVFAPRADADLLGRRRLRGEPDPAGQRHGGHRHPRPDRRAGGRQDRHHRRLLERLVRRATPRSTRPPSGWATPTRTGRCTASTASRWPEGPSRPRSGPTTCAR